MSIAEIPRPDASNRTYPVVPEKIKARLVAKCSRTLPHQVGQVFTDTILACLDFEQETKEMTAYDQHRYYEANVVDGIVKIIGRI